MRRDQSDDFLLEKLKAKDAAALGAGTGTEAPRGGRVASAAPSQSQERCTGLHQLK